MPTITITASEAVLLAIQDSLQHDSDFWVNMLDDTYGIDRDAAQELINNVEIEEC